MNKNIILPLLLCLSLILSFLGLYIVFKFDEQLQYNNKKYCYKEYCLFSNSGEEADNYFFGSSPIVEDDNSNLLVSALSSIMKYPIYNYEVDNDDGDDNDDVKNIWQEVKFDEIYKLNLIGDKLSLDKNQQLYYNHNNNNNNDCPFNIKIKKFYGRTLHLKDLYRNTTIKELNLRIKNILRADPIIQKIVFNGRKVTDGDKDLQYYGIKKNSVLHLDLLPFSPSPSSFKDKKDKKKKNIIFKRFINQNFINKLYDNAFTLYNDFGDNKSSSSSSQCNWIKFAIDNKQIIPKGWKISYHGTSRFKHNSIANQGNILLRQLQHQENHLSHPHPHPQNLNNLIKFSDGIFTTPDLKLAELYSKIFYFKGEKYKVIFQHLVKEKSLVKIKRFDIRNDRLDEYWVSPCENELKPFGVLVKKVENCD